jgi:hypothetical protein
MAGMAKPMPQFQSCRHSGLHVCHAMRCHAMAVQFQLCECMQNAELQTAGSQPKALQWKRLITFLMWLLLLAPLQCCAHQRLHESMFENQVKRHTRDAYHTTGVAPGLHQASSALHDKIYYSQ